MKAVIMAGGKGTRIASVNADVPKPMISIAGKPILEHQIEVLRRQGIRRIVIVVGHMGDKICSYFDDGREWNVAITYEREQKPLGTAGALYRLKDKIREDFVLINGDIIFDIDFERMIRAHREHGGIATIFTHPNSHPYDSAVIEAGEHHEVIRWFHKEDERLWYRNRVNAGIHMLSPKIFELPVLQYEHKVDLDRDILKPLVKEKGLYVYDSTEYVKDMGTPERYREVEDDIRSGKVAAKNYSQPQRAIFMDRDGTINRHVGFLSDIDQFELLEGAAEAIRRVNEMGYLAVVVTNQPVIARGEATTDELKEIHNKMETLLGQKGAYVDAIFYCPHHPDRGYEGEIVELKTDCDCRKPKPGLILQAAETYHIDLKNSWMIGDSGSDVLAGKAAGCKTVGLGETGDSVPDFRCVTLTEAIETIFGIRGKESHG